jgi:hypothetical protein
VARPASFDVVGYTMMSCADLRAAFERLIRYLLILSDALTMTMEEEPGGYRVTFVLFGGERPVPRQRMEFIFVTVIGFLRASICQRRCRHRTRCWRKCMSASPATTCAISTAPRPATGRAK